VQILHHPNFQAVPTVRQAGAYIGTLPQVLEVLERFAAFLSHTWKMWNLKPEMAHAHHEAAEWTKKVDAQFCFDEFKGTCKQAQAVLSDLFSYELPEDIKDAITYITEYASRFDDNAPLVHHNFRQAAKWWFQHKFDVPQKHWALFLTQNKK